MSGTCFIGIENVFQANIVFLNDAMEFIIEMKM